MKIIESKYDELISELNGFQEKKLTKRNELIKSIEKNKEKTLSTIETEKDQKQKNYKDLIIENRLMDMLQNKVLPKYDDNIFQKIKELNIQDIFK